MPITCRQCGWQSPDGADFCTNKSCGAYLEWDATRTYRVPPPGARPRRPENAGSLPQAAQQRAGVHLVLEQRVLEVEPGSSVTTTLTIRNTGTLVENLQLVVQGPAAGWATVEPETVPVYPDGSASSTLRFAPPRSVAAPAGQAWYAVRAVSTVHPGLEAGADGTLSVGAFRELDAELVPRITRGRFRTVHAVRLTNEGNVVEPVALQASDPEGVLRFDLPTAEVPVQPGTAQVDVAVRAPRRVFGRPQSYPSQVVVTPRDALPPLRLDGSRDTAPLFARWMPLTAVAVAVLAVLAFAVPRLPVFDRAGGTTVPTAAPLTEAPPPPSEPPPGEPPASQVPPPVEPTEPPPPVEPSEPPPPVEPPPPPPPPPPVHAEGDLDIRQTFLVDLDEGLETKQGADIWFQAETATDRFITPRTDAVLASIGVVEPSHAKCTEAELTAERIPLQDLPAGTVVCVLTDEQRLSVVVVEEPPGPSPGILGISYTTFEN